MKESDLRSKVIKFLRKQPGVHVMPLSDRWHSGYPDILFVYRGLACFAELKIGRNKPTRLQDYEMRRIREAGGRAVVCYSLDEVKEFMKGLDAEAS